jgi:hypothetical protein
LHGNTKQATIHTMNDKPSNDLEDQEPETLNPIPADDDLPASVDQIEDDGADDFIVDAPPALDFTFSASGLEELDIEGALASIIGLDAAIAEHEAADLSPAVQAETSVDPEQVRRETETRRKASQQAGGQLQQPNFGQIGRGKLASVIPAVLLMALGAGLTIYLAEPSVFGGLTLNTGLFIALLASVFSVMLISYWLSSGRWASGGLFVAISILASIAVSALGLTGGFPLLLSAIGLGAFVSALLSRGTGKNQYFVGIALMIAGAVGYGFNLNADQFDMTRLQPILLGVMGVFLAVLLIAPFFVKKQR